MVEEHDLPILEGHQQRIKIWFLFVVILPILLKHLAFFVMYLRILQEFILAGELVDGLEN